MKSDAPKGEDLEDNNDMVEPSEEEESEYDPNFDPMGRNRWAEPHGPQTVPG